MNRLAIRPLVRAVNRWLSFQDLCGRSSLFSEAYLAQPIGEFLLSNYRKGHFEAERDHPTLNATHRGRPNQIDYVLLSPETKALVTAIECKWVTGRNSSKQLMVDDLLRLECIRFPGRHVIRYFLVGGRLEHFDNHFKLPEVNAGGSRLPFASNFLSFDQSKRKQSVSVINTPVAFRKYYNHFQSDYNVELPKTFVTHLASRTRVGQMAVYMWEVRSVANRATFKPSEQWPS